MNFETKRSGRAGAVRRGFTIIELLMVIGIISVLMGITVSAISGSMKRARAQKARATCILVEQGIATYYAQKDEWPIEMRNVDSNSDVYTLKASEVREMVKNVVLETKKGNPMMDVSGLFVAKSDSSDAVGMDFLSAVRGTKRNPSGISLSQMHFGYPDPKSGHFRRFKMTYSPAADKVTVSMQ